MSFKTFIVLLCAACMWMPQSTSDSVFAESMARIISHMVTSKTFDANELKRMEEKQHFLYKNLEDNRVTDSYEPIVDTTSGVIRGVMYNESHAFYSIPYAQPPIGELR